MKFAPRKWFLAKLAKIKLTLAVKWVGQYGLSVVRIERRAGTDYIVHGDGSFNKLGKQGQK